MTDLGPWAAPHARVPVHATARLPGSKSLTNRYLILAALATEQSRLRAPLRSRDTQLMAQALRSLGAGVEDFTGDDLSPAGSAEVAEVADWVITPSPLHGPASVDCGLAGTVMRFMPPVAALARGRVALDGEPRARARPMRPILDALRDLGVTIEDQGRSTLPFTVVGSAKVAGGQVTLDASESSQFVSALLLAAPRFEHGVTVRHQGRPLPSEPHLRMTVEVLRDAGAVVDDAEPNVWRVEPSEVHPLDVLVEPDLSNAAPFLAAAVVTGGTVRVPDWPHHTCQPGDELRDILDAMGAEVRLDRDGLVVSGSGTINGLDVDLHDAGELTPVIAALAALADSPSCLRGIAHLRGHETDRLAALATEINALGGAVTETDEGLRIAPRPLTGGLIHTYDDHRIAMAAAVLGLAVPGVTIENVETTSKTLPGFTELWEQLLTDTSAPA